MMNRFFNAGFAGTAFMALAVTAMAAGPKYTEMGDAPDLPPGQATMGIGLMQMINGNLGMATLAGEFDLVDMYLINIVDPTNFRVTTDPMDGDLGGLDPFADFDTQLWLFQPTGLPAEALGLLGNDDHFELGGQFSLLLPDATDGGPGLMAAGFYLLAITRSNHDPFSGAGGPMDNIFDQMDPQEISSADGPGGMSHVTIWDGGKGGAFDGDYRIALQGVEFAKVPAPGALSLFIIAAVGARRGRRRSLLR